MATRPRGHDPLVRREFTRHAVHLNELQMLYCELLHYQAILIYCNAKLSNHYEQNIELFINALNYEIHHINSRINSRDKNVHK